jgi:hypothetical protein
MRSRDPRAHHWRRRASSPSLDSSIQVQIASEERILESFSLTPSLLLNHRLKSDMHGQTN